MPMAHLVPGGAKFVNALTYDDFSQIDTLVGQLLFDNAGLPTTAFAAQAETNRQSRNLGPALVRLNSTDARMVKGSHGLRVPLAEDRPVLIGTGPAPDSPEIATTGVAALVLRALGL